MTTSPQPWALSALSACAVVDCNGRHIALFDDPRDAELVVEMMKKSWTPEDIEELVESEKALQEELEDEERESAKLEEENRELEERVKELEGVWQQAIDIARDVAGDLIDHEATGAIAVLNTLKEAAIESTKLKEENQRLAGPAPQPRFTSPLPWVADWQRVCLFPAYQPNDPRGERTPLAKFRSASDLDYVVRLLERAKP